MAPSPTGPLHVGTARTALFNWLFARNQGGAFILRIEDTDKERSEKKYEDEILAGLAWLGIDWDEGPLPMVGSQGTHGPYRQSERSEIYERYLKQLLDKGEAYYCYCTKEELDAQRDAMASQGLSPKYNGHCRNSKSPPPGRKPQVIRFKVPEVKVEFKDIIRGKIVFDAALIGDQVIAKDLKTPLYNFAVVVDDELMEISHVIRGEDHLANTPKQILMQRALGFHEPLYAHIPLILNPDRSKMSKRFADTSLLQYREKGYLPQAMLNFLALLGWHPKDDREVFDKRDLVKEFDLSRVQAAGAAFNEEKLNWLNREYLKKCSDKEIAGLVAPLLAEANLSADHVFIERWVSIERTRANNLRELVDLGKFFFELPDYESSFLTWKEGTPDEAKQTLRGLKEYFEKIQNEQFADKPTMAALVAAFIGDRKRGAVLWPLRVALSGQKASPDPLDIMFVLGKEETLRRLALAIDKIKA